MFALLETGENSRGFLRTFDIDEFEFEFTEQAFDARFLENRVQAESLCTFIFNIDPSLIFEVIEFKRAG